MKTVKKIVVTTVLGIVVAATVAAPAGAATYNASASLGAKSCKSNQYIYSNATLVGVAAEGYINQTKSGTTKSTGWFKMSGAVAKNYSASWYTFSSSVAIVSSPNAGPSVKSFTYSCK